MNGHDAFLAAFPQTNTKHDAGGGGFVWQFDLYANGHANRIGEVMLTDADTDCAPTADTTEVVVGFYDQNGDPLDECFDLCTWPEAVDLLTNYLRHLYLRDAMLLLYVVLGEIELDLAELDDMPQPAATRESFRKLWTSKHDTLAKFFDVAVYDAPRPNISKAHV